MTDDVEQKLELPKIRKPSDATQQDSVISGQPNQDIHGEAFARAHIDDKFPSGILPAIHESFGIEGQLTAADTGKKPDSRIAIRDDYLDRSESRQETEAERHARIMKEHYAAGEPLSSFLQRPGFRDAISASPTIAQTLEDFNSCKWSKDIRVWRGHPTEITDYSAQYNLMELDSKDGARRQVEVFAHEAYHATHQDLEKLYGNHGPVTQQDFVSIKMQQEAGAFLREIRANEELHQSRPNPLYPGDNPRKHIEYMWIDKANLKQTPHKQDMNALLFGKAERSKKKSH